MSKCGFITILGAPNAGKSTLLNALLGQKIAIVSPKAQTTRNRTLGVLTEDNAQMIFVDTPGIFDPRRRLDRAMVTAAFDSVPDADTIIVLVDANAKTISDNTQTILDKLKAQDMKALLVLNKIDQIEPERLLPLIALYQETGLFSDIIPVSALTGDGLDQLKTIIKDKLPESAFLYPEDHLTDLPERLLAAEITREQLYLQLGQELPYAAMVETESFEEFKNGDVKISQSIVVQRDTQKAIVLGKGGTRIKAIRLAAQAEMEKVLDRKIHLFLNVKVRANWDERRENYTPWGLEFNS